MPRSESLVFPEMLYLFLLQIKRNFITSQILSSFCWVQDQNHLLSTEAVPPYCRPCRAESHVPPLLQSGLVAPAQTSAPLQSPKCLTQTQLSEILQAEALLMLAFVTNDPSTSSSFHEIVLLTAAERICRLSDKNDSNFHSFFNFTH